MSKSKNAGAVAPSQRPEQRAQYVTDHRNRTQGTRKDGKPRMSYHAEMHKAQAEANRLRVLLAFAHEEVNRSVARECLGDMGEQEFFDTLLAEVARGKALARPVELRREARKLEAQAEAAQEEVQGARAF